MNQSIMQPYRKKIEGFRLKLIKTALKLNRYEFPYTLQSEAEKRAINAKEVRHANELTVLFKEIEKKVEELFAKQQEIFDAELAEQAYFLQISSEKIDELAKENHALKLDKFVGISADNKKVARFATSRFSSMPPPISVCEEKDVSMSESMLDHSIWTTKSDAFMTSASPSHESEIVSECSSRADYGSLEQQSFEHVTVRDSESSENSHDALALLPQNAEEEEHQNELQRFEDSQDEDFNIDEESPSSVSNSPSAPIKVPDLMKYEFSE